MLQVASLQREFPELVATFYMSYLQQEPDAPGVLPVSSSPWQPGPGAPGRPPAPVQALPSTGAGAAVAAAADGGIERPLVTVPRIIFLYKLAPGIADKSFGARFRLPMHPTPLHSLPCAFSQGVGSYTQHIPASNWVWLGELAN